MRAAAAITSITMNGGTALRPEGASGARVLLLCMASPARPLYRRIARVFELLNPISPMIETTTSPRRMTPARLIARRTIALAAAATILIAQAGLPARAQAGVKGINVIRDAETEELLRDYTRPILKAAGLAQQNIEVVIINDRIFNAFVADGRRIFINLGALYESATPNQIIGVLAHETGHIAGGHLARLREQIANAQTAAVIAMLLAIGGVAAGAATGRGNVSEAAGGLMTAPGAIIQRSLLSYVRSQEDAADRAGVKFLDATGQSARGMLETFQRFASQSLFLSKQVDPYLLTHPMPRERIAQLETLARQSPHYDRADPPQLQFRHDMMRAKLVGYLDRPEQVLRRYPTSNHSLPARYARAVSAYRNSNTRDALAQIDALIAEQPNNPYFHELKGQALLEAGRSRDAIAPLQRAVQLSNGAPLIRMMLGQAMVQSGDVRYAEEAVRELLVALQREPNAPLGLRELAVAYSRKGDQPNAALASAQAAFNEGDFRTARQLAARARGGFANGSPGWLKADDIVNFKPPKIGQN
jgi:predicted Zn-dependent protease